MSFLDKNNSEYISARLTQRGRRAIANGNFNISYFAIGDSEYDYSGNSYQNVLAPMDVDSNIKYPIKYDSSTSTTSYGIAVTGSTFEVIQNQMGAAGVISGNTITSVIGTGSFSALTGTNVITVTKPSGTSFDFSEYITLVLTGITGNTINSYGNNLTYKIVSNSGNTTTEIMTLDRETPVLSGLTGNFLVVSNNWRNEFPNDPNPDCYPLMPLHTAQHDPWKVSIVWGKNPIGYSYTGYTSFNGGNKLGTKELLGYNSNSGQIFTDVTGGTITGSYFLNSFNEKIEVLPNEQNAIAILHYTENGDIINDPDRFFKYDDYLTTGDTYFEIYNPFMYYHRNTGTTIGAKFHMGTGVTAIKHIVSTKNPTKSSIFYNDLLDEQNNTVGKVFPQNKIVVFDDPEIVAILDNKSNRKYTLPSPKLESTHTNDGTYLHDGSSGKTIYITYALYYSGDNKLNALPCNYINKVKSNTATNVAIKFTGSTAFNFLKTSAGENLKSGTVADKLYILVQVTDNNTQPSPTAWRMIEKTPVNSGFITPASMNGFVATITRAEYDTAASSIFTLSGHTSFSYTGYTGQFGERQPFAGSVKVTRESTIEEMKFLVNLPSGKFNVSQNPTFASGNPVVTEVALLDSNKEVLVMGKTATPITRTGDQVFAVKLDF
jgi:hypothetical protein